MSNPATSLYAARQALYQKIEESRSSRVVAYVTGDRLGMETLIHSEVIHRFAEHLDSLFPAKRISLLLYTSGGHSSAAWNLVNLLRLFCDDLEVLVPEKARSAGTLICLGANRIVMTKQATLGPIDPSLPSAPLGPQVPGAQPTARAPVSVEAVRGYLQMAKEDFGISGSVDMAKILVDLADRVHPLVLGETVRIRSQIQVLAAKLLKSQISDQEKTDQIISFLCSESGSHDYTINRREARVLGLTVENSSEQLYPLLKQWMANVRDELILSRPFNPVAELGAQPQVTYQCVRALIESTAAPGSFFVTRGELQRSTTPHATLGPQESISSKVLFEGWEER